MMALARHGGSLRELRAREQKATKKVQLMKKRYKLLPSEEASDAATNDAVAAETKRQLKIEMESIRDKLPGHVYLLGAIHGPGLPTGASILLS